MDERIGLCCYPRCGERRLVCEVYCLLHTRQVVGSSQDEQNLLRDAALEEELNREPFTGKIELENRLILNWMRFANSAQEAIRIVTAQHVHVTRCWIESLALGRKKQTQPEPGERFLDL